MRMMSYRETEKHIPCPFNTVHQILPHRMASHIAKCWRNHPDADVKRCPFNATHIVKTPLYQAHMLECPDVAIVERDCYRRQKVEDQLRENKTREDSYAVLTSYGGEDWDREMVDSSYNPAEHVIFKESTRAPPAGMGKAARRAWRAVEVERVQRIKEGRPIDDLVAAGESIYTNSKDAQISENTGNVVLQESGSSATAPVDSSSVMRFDKPLRRPRIAANIGLNLVSGNMDSGRNNVEEEQPDGNMMTTELKMIIKQKRTLEKRLVGIQKLENKVKQGHEPTSEEQTKIGRKQETELQLAKLLKGVNLEE